MTANGLRVAVSGIAFCIAATATHAQAAKGVKKVNSGTGPHTYTGVVVSVNPNGTGTGTFHVRTMHHHKKLGMVNQAGVAGVNNNNGATQHIHEFNVSGSTQFVQHNGMAADAALLHTGERVRVRATGGSQAAANPAAGNQAAGNQIAGHHQAVAVQFMSHHRSRGLYTRHRSNGYYPHYHHTNHHRR